MDPSSPDDARRFKVAALHPLPACLRGEDRAWNRTQCHGYFRSRTAVDREQDPDGECRKIGVEMRRLFWPVFILVYALFLVTPFAHGLKQRQQALPQPSPSPQNQLPGELADLSPGQALITYEDKQLTIKARGASLSDVLREVCDRIGAQLD